MFEMEDEKGERIAYLKEWKKKLENEKKVEEKEISKKSLKKRMFSEINYWSLPEQFINQNYNR